MSDSEDIHDDPERVQIRNELSGMSFEELMKLKDELGSKVYNEAIFGTTSSRRDREKGKQNLKRLNKNRPREQSSKTKVPFLGINKKKAAEAVAASARDPRFDANSGDFDNNKFKENYSFLSDIRVNEIKTLKEKLSETVDEAEREQIKLLILRLENKNHEEQRRKVKEEVLKSERNEIRKAREEGKPVHYATKKERRTKELVLQYEELKNSGKLDKHLEKRRKKNTAKDRKKFSFD